MVSIVSLTKEIAKASKYRGSSFNLFLVLKVCTSPQSTSLLTILQCLLQIDPEDDSSDLIWEILVTTAQRAVALESKEAAAIRESGPAIFLCLIINWHGERDKTTKYCNINYHHLLALN